MRHTVRAEYTKLVTLRASRWLLLAICGALVVTGAALAATLDPSRCRSNADCAVDPVKTSLGGVWVAQIAVVALAVLAVGSEYETGQIRVTLAAMPRGLTVMTAKAIIVGVAVTVAATTGVLGSLGAARLVLSGTGFTRTTSISPVSLADPATFRAAIGTVAYLVLVALLAVGAAALLRDTATTVIAVLGVLYLFSVLGLVLTNPIWHHRLQRFAPMSAGLAVQTTRQLDQLAIGPLAGVGLLATYSAAMLMTGTIAFAMRDG